VTQARQGVRRKLTPQAVATLEIALRLIRRLGMPAGQALRVSSELMSGVTRDSPVAGYDISPGITLTIDSARLIEDVAARLADAVEIAPLPRRGRPPGSKPSNL
jgi:hypothetical protein